MTAARQQRIDERATTDWVATLRAALAEAVIEGMTFVSKATVDETMRKWLAHVRVPQSTSAAEGLIGEATGLALELALYAPSFLGVRPVDRLAQRAKDRPRELALAPERLRLAKFRLFRIIAAEQTPIYRAQDLATGETFRLHERRLSPNALQIDLAARLCAIPDGLHVMVGPPIALGVASPPARDYIRPGKGIGDDQRCAGHVYRDYIRHGVGGGLNFGIRNPDEPVRLSCPEPELDSLAQAWLESGGEPPPSEDARTDACGLTNGVRITAALCSSVELRAAGRADLAQIYRVIATIQIETLHERGRIGSGETNPLEALRIAMAEQIAKGNYPREPLELFDEIARPFRAQKKKSANADDDLGRFVECIRALRAKTTAQGCTEQEALRAAEKVAELLERYGLSLSEIEMRKQTCEGFGIDTGRRKREPSDRCTPAIAAFCDCRVWSETSATGSIRYVFFGLPADVEAAHYLYDLVAVAFDTETEAFKRGKFYAEAMSTQRRGAISSFQIGLATGIEQKLTKLKAERQAAMFRSSGRDLVPVKASILEEELEKLGLNFYTRRAKSRRKVIAAAYQQGQAAGGKFEVHPGLE